MITKEGREPVGRGPDGHSSRGFSLGIGSCRLSAWRTHYRQQRCLPKIAWERDQISGDTGWPVFGNVAPQTQLCALQLPLQFLLATSPCAATVSPSCPLLFVSGRAAVRRKRLPRTALCLSPQFLIVFSTERAREEHRLNEGEDGKRATANENPTNVRQAGPWPAGVHASSLNNKHTNRCPYSETSGVFGSVDEARYA